ncbi:Fe-S cluster assembly sulfur transfer protein SufU [Pontiella sulfatireligans]|uniref:Zinc-dependent sulfurtransferase SufU n=1 Tax=Pontiella sulfatireligans TaxID=2750658 RepID=A0A6C2UEZ3_9BACT|nr:SUF system NifU family Fe-S cluster assembly protein [Pontiella sulfatireligans]VGO17991.1 Zinc-dependent sulfurtransferase SufU [Pontiella sulfatireligans]
MENLRELYQEVILDHNKNPRNFRKMEAPDGFAHGDNPLCGDQIDVYLVVKDGVVDDVSFDGNGCAICTASASMMTIALKGKTEAEATALFDSFHHALTEDKPYPEDVPLGKLKVLAGVKDYPVRVKCATLAWHTFDAALKKLQGNISTE